MKAAIVRAAGEMPVYADFEDPVPAAGENLVTIRAAALSPLVKSRASGAHYSSSGHFPFVVGVDGVGTLEDGRRVYFVLPKAPYGAMSERTVVSSAQCVAVPDDLDDVTAAAIANPGMSSWMAYTERARLKAGETVLVNGATGVSGRLAVQIARHLGARKIIATGRNPDVLLSLKALGADVTISLTQGDEALTALLQEQFAQGVDVVIDYLWGHSAELLLAACARASADAVPVRFVEVGAVSGGNINLPAAVLRSSAIEMMGSGIGSVPMDRMIAGVGELLCAAKPGGFQIETAPCPLSRVAEMWAGHDGEGRIVFTTESKNVA